MKGNPLKPAERIPDPRLIRLNKALEACKAAVEYDKRIQQAASDAPVLRTDQNDNTWAYGKDLDDAYETWLRLAKEALEGL